MTDNAVDILSPIADLETVQIREEDMPDVISKQYQSLVDTDRRIHDAEERCEQAREIAARQILAKGMRQNDAINSTQDAVRSLAEAQSALSDAQKTLFDNQQMMANGMRYLLVLGASSIAMNRVVIRELEAKLKQASKEELSARAREELIGVVKMLREQENAFSKQDRLSEQMAETKKTVRSFGRELDAIREIDTRQDATDERHDSLIAENADKNIEQDKQIEAIHAIDSRQDATDEKHDALIAENARKNKLQDREIERQREVDEDHEKMLKKIKKRSTLALLVAIVALIIALINFFS
jgi:hypothetical protein